MRPVGAAVLDRDPDIEPIAGEKEKAWQAATEQPYRLSDLPGINTIPVVVMPIELQDVSVPVPAVPLTYRWDVPAADDYILRLQITTTDGIDEARRQLIDSPPVDRKLTPMEAHWIRTSEPGIVLPSACVSLDHNTALAENARLQVLHMAYDQTEAACKSHGIDPHEPQVWIDAIKAGAQVAVDQITATSNAKLARMASSVKMLRTACTDVLEQNGLDDHAPVLEPTPDVSVLTVYASADVDKGRYADLAAANWITHEVAEPTDSAKRGLFEAMKPGGYLWTVGKTKLGVPEQEDLAAAMALIRASVKVEV